MNDLKKYFESNNKNLIHKWDHYFEIYDKYFSRFRNKNPIILEIGVSQGGSLQMWKSYFGKGAQIFGIDKDTRCEQFKEDGIEIFIGSQKDKNFLDRIKKEIPKVDILIDDGGHKMDQQIISFKEMYEHIKEGGIYVCEDINTSYKKIYGGGYKKRDTFIEYSKNLIDHINAWYSEDKTKPEVSELTKSMYGIHFYNGILVIEKKEIKKPFNKATGSKIF